jgi:hypothetical protein
MGVLEMDGMAVDQIIYWWDGPVVYLGRAMGGDDRPCLVTMISDTSPGPIYHRMRFTDERGLRATLASGCAATRATYDLAQDVARLEIVAGDEEWVPSTVEELLARDGGPTSLPPGRSEGDVAISRWGRDHWTLLRYLHSRHLAASGADPVVEHQRLRINPERHNAQAISDWPTQGSPWTSESGTRLKGYEDDPDSIVSPKAAQDAKLQIGYHDDIDCLEEIEAEGLLDILSTAHGIYRMTPEGIALSRALETHLAAGSPLDRFDPQPERDGSTASTATGEKA